MPRCAAAQLQALAGLEQRTRRTMSIEINQDPATVLTAYADISIAFEVREVLDVTTNPDGAFQLTPRRLPRSYVKDYDAVGESPARWAERFDLSRWAFFSAFRDEHCVGRAAIVTDTPSLTMLEGRKDLALLWDIRVVPTARRGGIGSALFDAAVAWALLRGCIQLKVETQNINVAACRFYARQRCALRAAHRDVYPELPDEIQLLWFKDLAR